MDDIIERIIRKHDLGKIGNCRELLRDFVKNVHTQKDGSAYAELIADGDFAAKLDVLVKPGTTDGDPQKKLAFIADLGSTFREANGVGKFLKNKDLPEGIVEAWDELSEIDLRKKKDWLTKIAAWKKIPKVNGVGISFQKSEGLVQCKNVGDGRVFAHLTKDGIEYIYNGFGGKIVPNPNKSTTVLGKFLDPITGDGTHKFRLFVTLYG